MSFVFLGIKTLLSHHLPIISKNIVGRTSLHFILNFIIKLYNFEVLNLSVDKNASSRLLFLEPILALSTIYRAQSNYSFERKLLFFHRNWYHKCKNKQLNKRWSHQTSQTIRPGMLFENNSIIGLYFRSNTKSNSDQINLHVDQKRCLHN